MNYKKNPVFYDESDARDVIRQCLKDIEEAKYFKSKRRRYHVMQKMKNTIERAKTFLYL